jgi:Carboxypeptidase regulatory-like domain
MKRFQFCQYSATAIACLGLVLPAGARAADVGRTPAPNAAAQKSSILDVRLGQRGTLAGQVVDAQGRPLALTKVNVRSAGSATDMAGAVTDFEGRFSVQNLPGGVYEVSSGGGSGVFRLWTGAASPPSANQAVLIVAGGTVNRAQYYAGNNYGWRPWCPRITNGEVVMGALLIAGVAGGIVAIAEGSGNHESQPGS